MAKAKSPTEFYSKPRPGEAASPATEAAIAEAERSLGVRLPEELRALLLVRNGGSFRLNRFKLKTKPPNQSYAMKNYRVRSVPGVGGAPTDNIVQMTAVATDEWSLPEGLVPLFGEGHWWCCLDYRASGPAGEPSVTHFEAGDSSDNVPVEVSIARSFAALLAGLAHDPEDLDPALIALDEGAPKRKQLESLLEGLGYRKWESPDFSQLPLPQAWESRKYASFVKGCDARIELWTNRHFDISKLLADQRPEKHPMLRIYVSPKDEEACLAELLAALGTGAVLLHGLE